MLGIFSILAESKVPGSVPLITGLIPEYSGDYMVPFEADLIDKPCSNKTVSMLEELDATVRMSHLDQRALAECDNDPFFESFKDNFKNGLR